MFFVFVDLFFSLLLSLEIKNRKTPMYLFEERRLDGLHALERDARDLGPLLVVWRFGEGQKERGREKEKKNHRQRRELSTSCRVFFGFNQ